MDKRVCLTGLGSIGLPSACILADAGYQVLGVDINEEVVAKVGSGGLSFSEENLQHLLMKAIQSGRLTTSNTPGPADIHIIAVPTLLDLDKQPDLSCVQAAIEAVTTHLRSGDLVLIESTCPIGTTAALAKKLRACCPGCHVAYCPERALLGNVLYELIHNDRIVGGVDAVSTTHALAFYKSFVQGELLATDAQTAEAVKLAENTFRDVNIAYANELSMIADRVGLNVSEVIRLANRHPRVHILDPGPGVGGYCITTNPWFLLSSAPDLGYLIAKAREINMQKTSWVIQKIQAVIRGEKANTIACLGLTYKANIPDIRESPAMVIVEALKKEVQVLCVDPYVPHTESLEEALAAAEIIVGLVAHSAFLCIPPHLVAGKSVLDFAGVFH